MPTFTYNLPAILRRARENWALHAATGFMGHGATFADCLRRAWDAAKYEAWSVRTGRTRSSRGLAATLEGCELLILAGAGATAAPAQACMRTGGMEIDCPVRHPSNAPVNANDRMKGAVDPTQWDRWNASREADDRAAAAHEEAERRSRVEDSQIRANNAAAAANSAEANRANAAAGYLDRSGRRSIGGGQ
jgi:hypothetical protein